MIKKRKIDTILKSIKKKKMFSIQSIYWIIFILSFLIAYFFYLDIKSHSLKEIIFKGSLIFFFNSFVVSVVFYILNEIIKFQSINALKSSIAHLHCGDWEWITTALINRPVGQLHNIVMTHPVTIFIVGILFLKESYHEEANVLFNKAINLDQRLSEINPTEKVSKDDIRFLNNIVYSENKFQKSYYFKQLWNRKSIRYSIIVIFWFFIVLNIIVQIVKIVPK